MANLELAKVWKARLLVAVQFACLALLVLQAHRLHAQSYAPFNHAVIVFGCLIILIAYLSLRPALAITPIPKAGAPFIASGIYRYVRHPMYLGLLMIGFGLSGLGDSATSWVIFTILFLDLQVKSRFEDHLLAELHPEAAHYQSHTSRIFPCLGSGCRAGAACSISDDTPGK